jgi:hypothetical protein
MTRWRQVALLAMPALTLLQLLLVAALLHHVYFDGSGLICFEPPTTGEVYDPYVSVEAVAGLQGGASLLWPL